jgi:hypothetical protein
MIREGELVGNRESARVIAAMHLVGFSVARERARARGKVYNE